jgi:hypothetical protein
VQAMVLKRSREHLSKIEKKKNSKKTLTSKYFIDLVGIFKMVIKWREREHEDDDNVSLVNQKTLDALWDYGLLKIFKCPNMCSHGQLMWRLVRY